MLPKGKYLLLLFTTINRLDIKINEDKKNKEFKDEYVIIAIDSTVSGLLTEDSRCKINDI